MELMITTPIYTVKTRTSSLSPLSVDLQIIKGRAEFSLYKVPKMANNGLVSECFMSKFHLEGMNLE